MPLAGNALERAVATVCEATGAGDQILYGAGDQNFVRLSERNTRADVDRDAADILAHNFAFAGVEASADFNPKLTDFVADGASTTSAPCRAVEGS